MTPRPQEHDAAIITAAAREIADELCQRYPDFGPVDKAASAIAEILEDGTLDGYAIAKDLEGYPHSWFGLTADCVEILDGARDALDDAREEAVEAWVKAEGVRPRLVVGATVTGLKITHAGGTGMYDGVIVCIDERIAEYTVRIPSLGHVEPGQLGPQGFVLPYERVEGQAPLNAQPELV